jgi:anti-sigma factor RsiW
MRDERHEELRLLVQADTDGELAARDAATVAAHLADCAECQSLQDTLRETKESVRAAAPYHRASEDFRNRMTSLIAKNTPAAPSRSRRLAWRFNWGWLGGSFGVGALAAASLLLLVALPQDEGIESSVIDSHIRALQPGHLLDVPSSNQHTVKPWFDGRLDFAPPVTDLAAQGFPLVGGRLDYVAGRPAAVLIYGRKKHIIDLFVWPNANAAGTAPSQTVRNGYNLIQWSSGQMNFWAASDLNKEELEEFVRDWRATQ